MRYFIKNICDGNLKDLQNSCFLSYIYIYIHNIPNLFDANQSDCQ